ncbi:iron-containing alcohol dehydrogenase [Lysinibacillus sp. G4S2]|uniref:iron-containing alcohol dehydrogenase n=1 Tax=Lysinibacillus sp. G4S2 TaxID=3055859 RepID=UPI0025A00374|nr:iron-containing alcohol dehydrogenase [Lysinibacillus sp. G4S2]MDM5247518.1 iron-containing alcohol dehydrogenase [Lysinibacillus sp. G4S2]
MVWDFNFNLPTSIEFGNGTVNNVGKRAKELGGKKALIITDKGLAQTGILKRVTDSLEQEGIPFLVYDEITPNPKDVDCVKAYEQFKGENIDLLLGLGGGSSMDTAKAIGVLFTHEGELKDRYGFNLLERDITPLICIPTTSGTGSEVTTGSVITDTITKQKEAILDIKLAPKLAIVDPELTLSLPKSITAATGMDALTHAIEAYTSNIAEPISDALSLYAIEIIAKYLPLAVEDGNNLEARQNMLVGSLIAGMAFTHADLGAVHAMAEPLGGLYDTPHGVANSIFLPHVFEYNISSNPEKHATVALKLGATAEGKTQEEIAQEGVVLLHELASEIGIPQFRDLDNVNPDDFDFLAEGAFNHLCTITNSRKLSKDDYLKLFQKTYEMEMKHSCQ